MRSLKVVVACTLAVSAYAGILSQQTKFTQLKSKVMDQPHHNGDHQPALVGLD
jgi:hypothetical protein